MKSKNYILFVFVPLILSVLFLNFSFSFLKPIITNKKIELFNALIGGWSLILGIGFISLGMYSFFKYLKQD
jgi:hypothetical protein